MKLKKIASLLLAGIMAVSMLAGCNTVSTGTEGEGEGEQGGSTTLSTTLGAAVDAKLKAGVPEHVTFADSAALNTALTYAVGAVTPNSVSGDYWVTSAVRVVNDDISDIVKDRLEADAWLNSSAAEYVGKVSSKETDGKGAAAVRTFAVSGDVSDDVIIDSIADNIYEDIGALQHYDVEGDNWYYDYTVSLSKATKTNTAGTNASVKYFTVLVVRAARAQD